jgi:predicted alpha/beta-hydrolase family hydrolase
MSDKQIEFGNGLRGIISGAGQRGPVIISHGAGRGMDAPILEKTASQLVELGFIVLRYNFGYLGKKPAPSQGGKNEKPELVSAIEYMSKHGKPILIGKSFGARVGSYVAAERDDIRALAFYGMPLVGMSAKSKPRDWSHLGNIEVPMLFITGDKDKLCPLETLAEVQKQISAPLKSEIVSGDHSFKPKSEDKAIAICVEWVAGL